MNAKFERWKRSYNRGLSYHGVPENEHTDKMARVYFARGWSAKAAAYDEMVEYIEYKRALRKRILQQALFPTMEDALAYATSVYDAEMGEHPATVPVEVTEEQT